jgi:hypothetical protein
MAVKKAIEMVNEPDKPAAEALPDMIVLKPQLVVRKSTQTA